VDGFKIRPGKKSIEKKLSMAKLTHKVVFKQNCSVRSLRVFYHVVIGKCVVSRAGLFNSAAVLSKS